MLLQISPEPAATPGPPYSKTLGGPEPTPSIVGLQLVPSSQSQVALLGRIV